MLFVMSLVPQWINSISGSFLATGLHSLLCPSCITMSTYFYIVMFARVTLFDAIYYWGTKNNNIFPFLLNKLLPSMFVIPNSWLCVVSCRTSGIFLLHAIPLCTCCLDNDGSEIVLHDDVAGFSLVFSWSINFMIIWFLQSSCLSKKATLSFGLFIKATS